MQLGDPVKLTGRVKDMVTVNQTTSVLVQSDDQPSTPGREFWFPEDQLQDNPPLQTLKSAAVEQLTQQ